MAPTDLAMAHWRATGGPAPPPVETEDPSATELALLAVWATAGRCPRAGREAAVRDARRALRAGLPGPLSNVHRGLLRMVLPYRVLDEAVLAPGTPDDTAGSALGMSAYLLSLLAKDARAPYPVRTAWRMALEQMHLTLSQYTQTEDEDV